MILLLLFFMFSLGHQLSAHEQSSDDASSDTAVYFNVKRNLGKKSTQSLSQGAKLLNPVRYLLEPFQSEIPAASSNSEISNIIGNNGLVHGYHQVTKSLKLNVQLFAHKSNFINPTIHYPSRLEISTIMNDMVFLVDTVGKIEGIIVGNNATTEEDWDKQEGWSKGIFRENSQTTAHGISRYEQKLLCSTASGDFIVIDAITGRLLDHIKLPSGTDCPPLLHNGMIYIVLYDGRLIAIDNGKILWQSKSAINVTVVAESKKCLPYGNTIIYNCGDKMIAVESKLGRIIWQKNISDAPKALFQQKTDIRYWTMDSCKCSRHQDIETTIYAADSTGSITALRAYDGKILWTKDSISLLDQIVIGGNSLFLTTIDNAVMAIEKHSGQIGWARQIDQDITGIVLTSSGLAVSTKSGVIYFLDPNSGSVLEELDLLTTIISRPIVMNNAIYIINNKNQICCYNSNPLKIKAKLAQKKFKIVER